MLCRLQILLFATLSCAQGNNECGLEHAYCHQNNIHYRAVDGSCNNLVNPNWGTQFSVYDRLIPAKYGYRDSPALCRSGRPLPNARNVSLFIFTEETFPDPDYTVSAVEYGQLVAHDISQNYLTRSPAACCNDWFGELDVTPDDCMSVDICDKDPKYSAVNATCMSVLRTQTNRQKHCSLHLPYTAQISAVTSFIDLSIIYGNSDEVCGALRAYTGGCLLVDVRDNHEWLPNCQQRDIFCPMTPDNERCYNTGDQRVDQNPHLTILHIIWAREHNRIARELAKINPHWNDERIFQVARTIAIAQHQHIIYYELLPCYADKHDLITSGIIYETDGFVDDYMETMRPHVYNEFAQAAFRHFHSLTPGCLSLIDASGCPYRTIVLRDHINRPNLIEKGDNFDSLLRGMTTQPSLTSDAYADPEMTNFFFPILYKIGFDIKSIDIQRGRDHGLGSYNDMREYCQLRRVYCFDELLDVMTFESVEKLASIYEHPDDIDLVVGGSLEIVAPGTLLGPTFACVLFEQFYRSRRADRFFFENTFNGFTPEQLREIRKSSISKLICDNGNHITYMQHKGFLQVSDRNPRVPCHAIPGPDLTAWREGR